MPRARSFCLLLVSGFRPSHGQNRNVWSAALPQAKSDVTGWSAQMYAAFVGVNHSWPDGMRCALFPLVIQSRETASGYGFGERRVRPFVPSPHSPADLAKKP